MNLQIGKENSIEEAPIELLLTADPSEALVRGYLEKGDCYIAKVEERVVGVVLVIFKDEITAEIINIAVTKEFQRKGIAKQLIEYVKKVVKEKDFSTLEVGTGNSSIFQLLLYQKCGFRITGIEFDFFRNNYSEPIYENGVECRDMVRLSMEL